MYNSFSKFIKNLWLILAFTFIFNILYAPTVKANSFSDKGVSLTDSNGNLLNSNPNGYVPVKSSYRQAYFGTYIADYMPGNPVAAECRLKVNGSVVTSSGTIDNVENVSGKTYIDVTCDVPFTLQEGVNEVYTGVAILTQSGSGTIPLEPAYDPAPIDYKKDSKVPVVDVKLVKNVRNCTISKLKSRHSDCKITVSYKAGDPAPGVLAEAEVRFGANGASATAVGVGPNANGVYHNYTIDLYDIPGVKGIGRHNVVFEVFAKDKADNTNIASTAFEARVVNDPTPTPTIVKKTTPTPTVAKESVTPTVQDKSSTITPSVEVSTKVEEAKNKEPEKNRQLSPIVLVGLTVVATLSVGGIIYLVRRFYVKK